MIDLSVQIDQKLIDSLGKIPLLLRSGPFGRCLRAYGKPIVPRAESLAASSRATESRLKWSRRFREDPAQQIDSRNHMGSKVTKSGSTVYVGATYPKGNKQQFVMPYKKGDSYVQNRWGKPGQVIPKVSKRGKAFTAIVNTKPQTVRFPFSERSVVRAHAQMKSVAEQAFLDQLNKEIRELKLG
jgi:hypothetical protein